MKQTVQQASYPLIRVGLLEKKCQIDVAFSINHDPHDLKRFSFSLASREALPPKHQKFVLNYLREEGFFDPQGSEDNTNTPSMNDILGGPSSGEGASSL